MDRSLSLRASQGLSLGHSGLGVPPLLKINRPTRPGLPTSLPFRPQCSNNSQQAGAQGRSQNPTPSHGHQQQGAKQPLTSSPKRGPHVSVIGLCVGAIAAYVFFTRNGALFPYILDPSSTLPRMAKVIERQPYAGQSDAVAGQHAEAIEPMVSPISTGHVHEGVEEVHQREEQAVPTALPEPAIKELPSSRLRFLRALLRFTWALIDVPIRVVEWVLLGEHPLDNYRQTQATLVKPSGEVALEASHPSAAPISKPSGPSAQQQQQQQQQQLQRDAAYWAAYTPAAAEVAPASPGQVFRSPASSSQAEHVGLQQHAARAKELLTAASDASKDWVYQHIPELPHLKHPYTGAKVQPPAAANTEEWLTATLPGRMVLLDLAATTMVILMVSLAVQGLRGRLKPAAAAGRATPGAAAPRVSPSIRTAQAIDELLTPRGPYFLLPPRCDLPPPKCDLAPPKCDLPPAKCDLAPPKCVLPPPKCDLPPPKCDVPPARWQRLPRARSRLQDVLVTDRGEVITLRMKRVQELAHRTSPEQVDSSSFSSSTTSSSSLPPPTEEEEDLKLLAALSLVGPQKVWRALLESAQHVADGEQAATTQAGLAPSAAETRAARGMGAGELITKQELEEAARRVARNKGYLLKRAGPARSVKRDTCAKDVPSVKSGRDDARPPVEPAPDAMPAVNVAAAMPKLDSDSSADTTAAGKETTALAHRPTSSSNTSLLVAPVQQQVLKLVMQGYTVTIAQPEAPCSSNPQGLLQLPPPIIEVTPCEVQPVKPPAALPGSTAPAAAAPAAPAPTSAAASTEVALAAAASAAAAAANANAVALSMGALMDDRLSSVLQQLNDKGLSIMSLSVKKPAPPAAIPAPTTAPGDAAAEVKAAPKPEETMKPNAAAAPGATAAAVELVADAVMKPCEGQQVQAPGTSAVESTAAAEVKGLAASIAAAAAAAIERAVAAKPLPIDDQPGAAQANASAVTAAAVQETFQSTSQSEKPEIVWVIDGSVSRQVRVRPPTQPEAASPAAVSDTKEGHAARGQTTAANAMGDAAASMAPTATVAAASPGAGLTAASISAVPGSDVTKALAGVAPPAQEQKVPAPAEPASPAAAREVTQPQADQAAPGPDAAAPSKSGPEAKGSGTASSAASPLSKQDGSKVKVKVVRGSLGGGLTGWAHRRDVYLSITQALRDTVAQMEAEDAQRAAANGKEKAAEPIAAADAKRQAPGADKQGAAATLEAGSSNGVPDASSSQSDKAKEAPVERAAVKAGAGAIEGSKKKSSIKSSLSADLFVALDIMDAVKAALTTAAASGATSAPAAAGSTAATAGAAATTTAASGKVQAAGADQQQAATLKAGDSKAPCVESSSKGMEGQEAAATPVEDRSFKAGPGAAEGKLKSATDSVKSSSGVESLVASEIREALGAALTTLAGAASSSAAATATAATGAAAQVATPQVAPSAAAGSSTTKEQPPGADKQGAATQKAGSSKGASDASSGKGGSSKEATAAPVERAASKTAAAPAAAAAAAADVRNVSESGAGKSSLNKELFNASQIRDALRAALTTPPGAASASAAAAGTVVSTVPVAGSNSSGEEQTAGANEQQAATGSSKAPGAGMSSKEGKKEATAVEGSKAAAGPTEGRQKTTFTGTATGTAKSSLNAELFVASEIRDALRAALSTPPGAANASTAAASTDASKAAPSAAAGASCSREQGAGVGEHFAAISKAGQAQPDASSSKNGKKDEATAAERGDKAAAGLVEGRQKSGTRAAKSSLNAELFVASEIRDALRAALATPPGAAAAAPAPTAATGSEASTAATGSASSGKEKAAGVKEQRAATPKAGGSKALGIESSSKNGKRDEADAAGSVAKAVAGPMEARQKSSTGAAKPSLNAELFVASEIRDALRAALTTPSGAAATPAAGATAGGAASSATQAASRQSTRAAAGSNNGSSSTDGKVAQSNEEVRTTKAKESLPQAAGKRATAGPGVPVELFVESELRSALQAALTTPPGGPSPTITAAAVKAVTAAADAAAAVGDAAASAAVAAVAAAGSIATATRVTAPAFERAVMAAITGTGAASSMEAKDQQRAQRLQQADMWCNETAQLEAMRQATGPLAPGQVHETTPVAMTGIEELEMRSPSPAPAPVVPKPATQPATPAVQEQAQPQTEVSNSAALDAAAKPQPEEVRDSSPSPSPAPAPSEALDGRPALDAVFASPREPISSYSPPRGSSAPFPRRVLRKRQVPVLPAAGLPSMLDHARSSHVDAEEGRSSTGVTKEGDTSEVKVDKLVEEEEEERSSLPKAAERSASPSPGTHPTVAAAMQADSVDVVAERLRAVLDEALHSKAPAAPLPSASSSKPLSNRDAVAVEKQGADAAQRVVKLGKAVADDLKVALKDGGVKAGESREPAAEQGPSEVDAKSTDGKTAAATMQGVPGSTVVAASAQPRTTTMTSSNSSSSQAVEVAVLKAKMMSAWRTAVSKRSSAGSDGSSPATSASSAATAPAPAAVDVDAAPEERKAWSESPAPAAQKGAAAAEVTTSPILATAKSSAAPRSKVAAAASKSDASAKEGVTSHPLQLTRAAATATAAAGAAGTQRSQAPGSGLTGFDSDEDDDLWLDSMWDDSGDDDDVFDDDY